SFCSLQHSSYEMPRSPPPRRSSDLNEYIASTEPWALARDPANATRLSQVLFDVAEAVRGAAVMLLPIMPASAEEILRRVGETAPDRKSTRLNSSHVQISYAVLCAKK